MYSQTVNPIDREKVSHIAQLVQLACHYTSHISIRNSQAEYNAKSIMGMMSLDLRDGSLQITANGDDEQEAVDALVDFLQIK